MPKFLIEADYSAAGNAGLLKSGGTKRKQVVEKMVKDLGGKVESIYFTFGLRDFICIAELPDNVTAAALSLTVNATGAATAKVTVLLTAEEIDAAVKKAPRYRAPGQ